MSYARSLETGTYIYPDGENVVFLEGSIPNDSIDIFLYKLYTNRRQEFDERIMRGKILIEQNKLIEE